MTESATAMKKIKLFIIKEVLYDYTPGMCVIAAENLDQCRELFVERFNRKLDFIDEFDRAILNKKYKVFDVLNCKSSVVSYQYGGG